MVITCEECGKKYRIDPLKIKGETAKFKCKSCSHLIVAHKPAPLEEAPPPAPPVPPEPEQEEVIEEKPSKAPKKKKKKKSSEYGGNRKYRLGLTAKLFIMMIFVSLLPLLMFWYITFQQTPVQIQDDTKRNINQISIGISKHVDEWMDKNVRIARVFAGMTDMVSMDGRLQEPLLDTIRKVNPWIYRSVTLDLNGMTVAGDNPALNKNASDSQYYKEVVGGKPVAWQILSEQGTGKPVLKLALPILNNGRTVGVLVNSVGLDELSSRIVTWEGADTGFAGACRYTKYCRCRGRGNR